MSNLPTRGQQGFQRTVNLRPGDAVGRWTLLFSEKKGRKYLWQCRCRCGKERSVHLSVLRNGTSKSCGCMRTEMTVARSTTHGLAARGKKAPEYGSWSMMIDRCTNPNGDKWKHYGQRGIKVCDRWLKSFADFLTDMGPRPSLAHSVERRDNNGDYEPDNCFWATKRQQANNKRTSRLIAFRGVTQTAAEWSRATGIGSSTICFRLNHGWTTEQALTTKTK